MQPRQLRPKLTLAFRDLLRNPQANDHIQIASSVARCRQAAFAEAKALPVLSRCRNLETPFFLQGRDFDLGPEHRLPGKDLCFVNQIAPLNRKIRMAREPYAQKQIAALA